MTDAEALATLQSLGLGFEVSCNRYSKNHDWDEGAEHGLCWWVQIRNVARKYYAQDKSKRILVPATRGWTFPEAVKLALAKLRCRLCKTSPAPHLWGEPTPMLVCDKCLALGDATIQAKWYALDAREKARRKPRRLEA